MKKLNNLILIFFVLTGCFNDYNENENKEMSIIFEQISNQFYGRSGACYLYFNSLHWIIGGRDSAYHNDVWNSIDGINWVQVAALTAFPAKAFIAGCVYDNKMWIFGGSTGSVNDSGIWSSSDGITWTNSGALPSTYPLHAMNTVVFNNKMWIFGGMGAPSDPSALRNNQIFSSSDGSSWTSHGTGAYGPREYSGVLVIGSYIYIIAGAATDYMSDVWRSSDGINWSQISTGQFTSRYGQKSVIYDNKMWVICGTNAGIINDAFYSSDGISWTELSIKLRYIYYHNLIASGSSVIIVGGTYNGISRINMNYTPPVKTEHEYGGVFL